MAPTVVRALLGAIQLVAVAASTSSIERSRGGVCSIVCVRIGTSRLNRHRHNCGARIVVVIVIATIVIVVAVWVITIVVVVVGVCIVAGWVVVGAGVVVGAWVVTLLVVVVTRIVVVVVVVVGVIVGGIIVWGDVAVSTRRCAGGWTIPSVVDAVCRIIQASRSTGVCASVSIPNAPSSFCARFAVGKRAASGLHGGGLRNRGAPLFGGPLHNCSGATTLAPNALGIGCTRGTITISSAATQVSKSILDLRRRARGLRGCIFSNRERRER